MGKIRIGMIGDTFLPLTGGAEYHILEMSRALRKLGHEVKIFTTVPGEAEVDGFKVVRFPALKGGSGRSLPKIVPALPHLAKFIGDCDIVECHYSYQMAFLGTILARLYRKPSLVTLHGLGTLDSSVRSKPLRKLYRFTSLKLASAVIATCKEYKNVALRFANPERVFQVSNGVDTDKFSPIVESKDYGKPLVVMTMRRLVPKNGVQYLMEAMPYILRENLDLQFWLVGPDRMDNYLQKRAVELNVDKNIRFLGDVPQSKVKEYYSLADIVVFPSSMESTSLACLEAMSMEKAVIASALTAYREMLGEDERGLLVHLFDRETSDYNAPLTLPTERLKALAEVVIKLARDRNLRQKIGKAARAFVVANYDWSIIASKTESIYTMLLHTN